MTDTPNPTTRPEEARAARLAAIRARRDTPERQAAIEAAQATTKPTRRTQPARPRTGTSHGPVYLRYAKVACGCDHVDLFQFPDGNQATLDDWAYTPEAAAFHASHGPRPERFSGRRASGTHRASIAMDWSFATYTVHTPGGAVYGTFRWDRDQPAGQRWRTEDGAHRSMTQAEEAVVAAAAARV